MSCAVIAGPLSDTASRMGRAGSLASSSRRSGVSSSASSSAVSARSNTTATFALTGHGSCREHDNKSRISQPVVHPAGTERRVLDLSDERLFRTGHRLVPIGERDLKQHAPGVDEVDLHTDATVGVVEAVRADDLCRDVCWRPPWLGRSPFGDECFLGWVRSSRGGRGP